MNEYEKEIVKLVNYSQWLSADDETKKAITAWKRRNNK